MTCDSAFVFVAAHADKRISVLIKANPLLSWKRDLFAYFLEFEV